MYLRASNCPQASIRQSISIGQNPDGGEGQWASSLCGRDAIDSNNLSSIIVGDGDTPSCGQSTERKSNLICRDPMKQDVK